MSEIAMVPAVWAPPATFEANERLAVVAEAKSWIGTPFHHMGWVKGRQGGADCATSTLMIYRAALPHRVPALALDPYSPQWHLSRGAAERYLDTVTSIAGVAEIAMADARPGDLVLYRLGHAWAHGAILMPPGWPQIAHADADAGMFVEGIGDGGRLAGRAKRFFSFWPVVRSKETTP